MLLVLPKDFISVPFELKLVRYEDTVVNPIKLFEGKAMALLLHGWVKNL